MSDHFYKSLMCSPFVKDDISVEELAIWIDMNITKQSDAIKVFKAIEKNYYNGIDQSFDVSSMYALTSKVLKNSIYGSYGLKNGFPNCSFNIGLDYCSDKILVNLFNVIDKTDALDKYVLNDKFMSYAKNARDLHREKITGERKIGGYTVQTISRRDEDLYEVFAELVGILEKKITKKGLSLLS